jgi:hypothetical protein
MLTRYAGFFYQLDSRLMKQLAIRLSWQTTPAKSLVMRGNDGFNVLSEMNVAVILSVPSH